MYLNFSFSPALFNANFVRTYRGVRKELQKAEIVIRVVHNGVLFSRSDEDHVTGFDRVFFPFDVFGSFPANDQQQGFAAIVIVVIPFTMRNDDAKNTAQFIRVMILGEDLLAKDFPGSRIIQLQVVIHFEYLHFSSGDDKSMHV